MSDEPIRLICRHRTTGQVIAYTPREDHTIDLPPGVWQVTALRLVPGEDS